MTADRYDVMVDEEVADEAARRLRDLSQPLDRDDPRFARERDTPAATAATRRSREP